MQQIIKKFLSEPNEHNMDQLIELFSGPYIIDEDIIHLAMGLADSGTKLNFGKNEIVSDIPSTGGPTSLSTLICPLVLAEMGFIIPKLGVPGRPAGGIDVLSQIPNYKIDFSTRELELFFRKYRYCHFLANDSFTPLDILLFNYRSIVGAKGIIPLVISSLLSKKLAVGINLVGLDVRVFSKGNFGENRNEAHTNSLKFIEIADKAGIKAICFLNELNKIQQPYVGRGEALMALYEIFYGVPDVLLKDHLDKCMNMGLSLTSSLDADITGIISKLKEQFIKNIESQGSSENEFIRKVKQLKDDLIYEFKSPASGFLHVDLDKLRQAIIWGQQNEVGDNKFPDPCGVVFKKYSNDFVEKGEVILKYRAKNIIMNEFGNRLLKSILINNNYDIGSDFEKII